MKNSAGSSKTCYGKKKCWYFAQKVDIKDVYIFLHIGIKMVAIFCKIVKAKFGILGQV